MSTVRFRLLLTSLAVGSLFLLAWTLSEARQQRQDVENALTAEASVLAQSLGPGLSAASHAVRELNEIVLWKLLDNARLLAELAVESESNLHRIPALVEANGLDTVVLFDRAGARVASFGEPVSEEFETELTDLLSGQVEEMLLGSTFYEGVDHLAAAASIPGGGAVLVRIHASSARTYARRLGVRNLLGQLVGVGRVLYLNYRVEPSGEVAEAAWDGEVVPSPSEEGSVRDVRGRAAFEIEMPLESPAGSEAFLRVGLDGTALHLAAVDAARRTLLVSLTLLGLAVAAGSTVIVNRLRAREKEEGARKLADAEVARRRNERLAAAGALTAGLAHEVRSPMNAIGLAAQRLERRLPEGEESREMATRIRSEVKRLEKILRSFLELAGPVSGRRESVDLAELVQEVVDLLGEEARSVGVDLVRKPGSAVVLLDPDSIHRALVNLVRNGIQASRKGGAVIVGVERKEEEARIVVLDIGKGVDEELADRVFDPFVSGRSSGTGLGLALVRRVAEEHDGTVTLENRPGGGACATLRIPLQRS